MEACALGASQTAGVCPLSSSKCLAFAVLDMHTYSRFTVRQLVVVATHVCTCELAGACTGHFQTCSEIPREFLLLW